MAVARNHVNLNAVEKGYGARSVLRQITLGINAGDRVGVVGRNGEGKSTLLGLIAGAEAPDAGTVTRARDLKTVVLTQSDELTGQATIREALVGGRAKHEWAGDAGFRTVLDGLLGGVGLDRFPAGLDTAIGPLSGGERRRVALARVLLEKPQLLALDEPTNHLDVDAINWLAGHLAARNGSLLVVTHDRWFLDAVCTTTWEVADGTVHQYDGGYAAFVLARAERDRQAAARDDRRRQLLRKELAWLRTSGADLQTEVSDRVRQRVDRRRAGSARPRRAAAFCQRPPRQQGFGRGERIRGVRRQRSPAWRDVANRAG